MFLYIARHAWAGEFGDPAWPNDSLRPLTREGTVRYRGVAETLVERGFHPGMIASSPYVRCRQTAQLLAEALDPVPRLEELSTLAPGAELAALLPWTNRHAGQDVCWVGHNPDCERLTAQLLGQNDVLVRFAKGTVAALWFDGRVEPGAAELYWLVTAKMLGV